MQLHLKDMIGLAIRRKYKMISLLLKFSLNSYFLDFSLTYNFSLTSLDYVFDYCLKGGLAQRAF
jgi:hypothetical protein